MCGIAGVFEMQQSERVDREVVQAMCDAITRRGPNDAGYFVEGHIGLGMRRLSIIDVAGGHQPIANEDGSLMIVFNGEIFNYRPLRAGLEQRGHRFTTRSDTETILHLFEEEGPSCLRHLRGMFALAIWNARTRSLFVARDRLGIKPLYYAFDGHRFIFGSEIKAILQHPSVSRRMNWTAIDASPHLRLRPGSLDRVPGHSSPARRASRDGRCDRCASVPVLGSIVRGQAVRVGGRHRGGVPRAVSRVRRHPDGKRSAARRLFERWCRFEPGRGDDGRRLVPGRQDLHDRVWRTGRHFHGSSGRLPARSVDSIGRNTGNSRCSPRSRKRSTSRWRPSTSPSRTIR